MGVPIGHHLEVIVALRVGPIGAYRDHVQAALVLEQFEAGQGVDTPGELEYFHRNTIAAVPAKEAIPDIVFDLPWFLALVALTPAWYCLSAAPR